MIYLVNINDLEELMNIYYLVRKRMIDEDNLTQWDNPEIFKKELIDYINKKVLYKVVKNSEIMGFFAYIKNGDNAYNKITGKWLNDNPYITIHKMASKYPKNGIGRYIIEYVREQMLIDNLKDIRIDTHKNNKSMNIFLEKMGFKFCGIISLNLDFNDEHQLRNAYQFTIDS